MMPAQITENTKEVKKTSIINEQYGGDEGGDQ